MSTLVPLKKHLKGALNHSPSPTLPFSIFSNIRGKKKPKSKDKEEMKLVWSPETASEAYIDTVKSCQDFKESGTAEFLSAMAAGWNAKLIAESWSHGGAISTSIGLAVAARHACARHVCIVPDERSRLEYIKAMVDAGMQPPEIAVGEAEATMEGLAGVDFLVVDCNCKSMDFARVLRFARLSSKGAVLACKNVFACQRRVCGFRWLGVLEKGTRVVRTVVLPVGKGLDIAYIGSSGGGSCSVKNPSRWIKHIDHRSGEEHFFRG